ncbi:hypothetical protein [Commensalibacter oyaizuii]|uniref:Uncharacterized protein n=1 Tax=Commensalibacter oyaizuii TaxID=3043873 RepID=A0ABT6Q410_9PROT|nr:hypothetical protein [Commensalibacter sp. TBRC 16381]MDI2091858.1 hypothetical protein [Commensalibacter sp. TBRC 16381]
MTGPITVRGELEFLHHYARTCAGQEQAPASRKIMIQPKDLTKATS